MSILQYTSITQANLQRSPTALHELQRVMIRDDVRIALIQEPCAAKNKVYGWNKKVFQCFYAKGSVRPRTCILVKKSIKAVMIPQISTRDSVSILCNLDNGREIILTSDYLHYNDPCPPTHLVRAIDYANQHQIPILLGCDANAHNLVWGSTNNNERGENLLEYLSTTNLGILNRGNVPTFVTRTREEVIDITLTNCNASRTVKDWAVSLEPSFSDHRRIMFKIQIENVETSYRNPKKTNWEVFKNNLQNNLTQSHPILHTREDVDNEVNYLTDSLRSAFDSACPIIRKRDSEDPKWWNSELEELRKTTRRAWRKAYQGRIPWAQYRDELKKIQEEKQTSEEI
jgi:hypothetical protein